MGKQQRKTRIRSARLAASASHGAAPTAKSPAAPSDAKKDVLPIIAKLKADDVSDRIWAAASLSGLIATGDASLRLLLLAQGLVGQLIELLASDNAELRLEVTGVLRNLAVEGGADVCAEMYNKHITPHLSAHLNILSRTLARTQAAADSMSEAQDEPKETRIAWDWAENVVTIFWSIAELAPKSLSTLANLPALVPFLLAIIKAVEASSQAENGRAAAPPPLSLGIAAAHCLAVLCDSNHTLSLRLLAYPAHIDLEPMIALLRPELHARSSAQTHLLGVLVASALLNICSTVLVERHETTDAEAPFAPKAIRTRALEIKDDVDRLAPRLLARVLDGLDLEALSKEASALLQNNAGKPASLGHENKVVALNDRLTAGQVALEVLGEISASIDGLVVDPDQEEEWAGIDGMDEDESPEESAPVAANGHAPSLSLSNDTLTLLSALPDRLIALAKPTTASFAPSSALQEAHTLATDTSTGSSSAPVPPTTAALFPLVHLRALECLNNLFVTLARSASGHHVQPIVEDGEGEADVAADKAMVEATTGATEARLPEAFAASAQRVWEGLFGILVELQQTILPPAPVATGKKAKLQPPMGSEELVHAVEAGVGAIWALARAHSDALIVGASEMPFLLSLLASTMSAMVSDEAKARAAGALGVLARRPDVTTAENKLVGDALLSLASSASTRMLLATQSLDSLFDIYADETRDYDAVFRSSGYLGALEALQSSWRTRAKQVDRRKEAELRAMADEAGTNLGAFIAYRRALPS